LKENKHKFFPEFLLFKVPASFRTAGSRLSPNHTTCGLSRPPQWQCGKSVRGIRAAVASGSGALCTKQKQFQLQLHVISVHESVSNLHIIYNPSNIQHKDHQLTHHLLEQLMLMQLVKKFPAFMEHEGSSM
jgi:hypothetical protein